MEKVDFYYDFVSPYAYLAWKRLEQLQWNEHVEITLRPILLGGIFKLTDNRAPAEIANKARYMFRDLLRLSRQWDIPFQAPSTFPFSPMSAMRLAISLSDDQQKLRQLTDIAFDQTWGKGIPTDQPGQLESWANVLGIDDVTTIVQMPEVKQSLIDATGVAVTLGLFGVPTFVHNEELFWGVDRMWLLQERLGIAKL